MFINDLSKPHEQQRAIEEVLDVIGEVPVRDIPKDLLEKGKEYAVFTEENKKAKLGPFHEYFLALSKRGYVDVDIDIHVSTSVKEEEEVILI